MVFLVYKNNYYFEYSIILMYLLICCLIVGLILGFSYLLIRKNGYTEKVIPYECGFEPYEDTRNIFNVQFYLVALLFLIFDLESLYIYPVAVSILHFKSISIFVFLEFLLELLIGYVYIYRYILKQIV